ncbi:MAG: dihydroorotase [Candidatus Syntrophonatronum acetioxidans]|uniref:Dihydroorotase n=1 Tax=Candidatus Syntrophonatronum acetioxidans TaxID=1795816 RepID=A0A424Y9V3_9FIRM|nr:MAG: dihydroorotase [Candidatus Syntrophonatronum acetioxidans]
MSLLIKSARIFNSPEGLLKKMDILIKGEKIYKIAPGLGKNHEDTRVIDARGKVVAPGLIDLHVHLRQPGEESKETIKSGCASAAAGGFTSIACMPNTRPVTDNIMMVERVNEIARREGVVKVYPVGAITKGSRGEELAEIGLMVEGGIRAVSDDGKPVEKASMMGLAMEYAKMFHLPLISHCEDPSLARGGAMNLGFASTRLGLKGIPDTAEAVMVARDVLLAQATGAHLHIAHVSCAKSVEIIEWARSRGIKVTAEVTPHHLSLTEEEVGEFDTDYKMNPPLRSREDVDSLRKALKKGTIDIIATDHAPHTREDKRVEFDRAPFGVVGLETALPVVLTQLVHPGHLKLEEALASMTIKPAEILGLDAGVIKEGADADLTIIDLDKEDRVEKEKFYSRGKNTPFQGWKVKGGPCMTIVKGKIVMKEGKVYF